MRQPAPGVVFIRGGCPLAQIAPVVIQRDGNQMVFVEQATGVRRPLSWPSGFSARVLNGKAELVTPGGNVFGREGDVLSNLAGCAADNGDLVVCFDSVDQYERASAQPTPIYGG